MQSPKLQPTLPIQIKKPIPQAISDCVLLGKAAGRLLRKKENTEAVSTIHVIHQNPLGTPQKIYEELLA